MNNEEIKKPFPNILVPTKPKGASEVIARIFYIVMTDAGNWGRGQSLESAMEAANALTDTGRKRKRLTVKAWVNIQTEGDVMTEEGIKSDAQAGITHVGYKAGDYLQPFVSDYGEVCYKGKLCKLDLPK